MGNWKFTGNDFDERDLQRELDEVVTETAHAVAEDAAHLAPVDSGALEASFYASTPKGSNYSDAVSAMRERNSKIEADTETQREDWLDDDIHTALVDSAAPYADLIEYGHFNVRANRFIAGRPSLGNALRGQSDRMMSRAARALRALKARNVSKG